MRRRSVLGLAWTPSLGAPYPSAPGAAPAWDTEAPAVERTSPCRWHAQSTRSDLARVAAAPAAQPHRTEPCSGAYPSFNRTCGFRKPTPLYLPLISTPSRASPLPGPLRTPTAAAPRAGTTAANRRRGDAAGRWLRAAEEQFRAINPLETRTTRHGHHTRRIASGAGQDGSDGPGCHRAAFAGRTRASSPRQ